MGAVITIKEKYRCGVQSKEELSWFFFQARRFLDKAFANACTMSLTVATATYAVSNIDDINVAKAHALSTSRWRFQAHGFIVCKVTFYGK